MAGEIEQILCSKCGADVREGALYCYGCGSAIAEVSVPAVPPPALATATAEPERETVSDAVLEEADRAARESSAPARRPVRQRRPRPEPKNVEIVWAEPEGSNSLFITGALVLAAVAVVLVFLGLYLR